MAQEELSYRIHIVPLQMFEAMRHLQLPRTGCHPSATFAIAESATRNKSRCTAWTELDQRHSVAGTAVVAASP